MPGYKRQLVSGLARPEIVPGGTYWHELDDDGPLRVFVRLGSTPDGRLACFGVAFDGKGEEITARGLRETPLGELVAEAIRGASGTALFRAGRDTSKGVITTRPGPSGYPPEHYEHIAELYRQALRASPRAPMKWLREQLGFGTEPTLRRWVQRARDRGLLGASAPGKAGEQPTMQED